MKIIKLLSLISLAGLFACNGGSSSNSGMMFTGSLTQGDSVEHSANLNLRHGAGENIESVQVCALGECSTTDVNGTWGFAVTEDFKGGPVLFSLDGHGISTTAVVDVPELAEEVFVHFQNEATGIVVHHMSVDGVEVELEHSDAAHEDDTEHMHE
jgi:hypothetical protein